VIKDFGIPTAPFLIMNDMADLEKLNLQFPLFIKPVAEGTGKGISQKSLIQDPKDLKKLAEAMLIQFNQPVLIEEYLPGREFTVGVVGNGSDAKMVGIMEVVYTTKENQIYSYETKTNYKKYVTYRVPEEAVCKQCEKSALEIWKVLACRDAGRVDFRNDRNGIPNFIEINPLAGLNYIHSDLPILANFHGTSFDQLIAMILDAAFTRSC
jgi:D-alanine-D-alanine ligase